MKKNQLLSIKDNHCSFFDTWPYSYLSHVYIHMCKSMYFYIFKYSYKPVLKYSEIMLCIFHLALLDLFVIIVSHVMSYAKSLMLLYIFSDNIWDRYMLFYYMRWKENKPRTLFYTFIEVGQFENSCKMSILEKWGVQMLYRRHWWRSRLN